MLSTFNLSQRRTLQKNAAWELIWPYNFSTILGILILFIGIAIVGLEIGVLATIGNSNQYPDDFSTTGAGLWCGIPVALTGLEIIALRCFTSVIRQRTMITLISIVLTACSTIVLIGLDAKAVQTESAAGYFSVTDFYKPKLVAAQLALAILVLLLFLIFVGICVAVQKSTSQYVDQQPQSIRFPTQRV